MNTPTAISTPAGSAPVAVLEQQVWQEREARHHERVDALVAGHLERRRDRVAHPVEDFLFTYYSYKPSQLRRWYPGAGVVLLGEAARHRLDERFFTEIRATGPDGDPVVGVGLDLEAFTAKRGSTARFVVSLLTAVASRPAHLGCFGLHEWAMVYRRNQDEVRHSSVPLRLGAEGTDRVVESHRIQCSHYDAFRFFTPEARPLNRLRPSRDTQIELDQPGCLHATMDLYKWAYKLAPAVPGELLVDCFELARDVRELDMRASPYDLSGYGYEPVRIETAQGKAEYMAAQEDFAERGKVLRARLLAACAPLVGTTATGGE
ncbi:3-methyladenine DNA glycosylase [Nocardiopsis rhodophaea]